MNNLLFKKLNSPSAKAAILAAFFIVIVLSSLLINVHAGIALSGVLILTTGLFFGTIGGLAAAIFVIPASHLFYSFLGSQPQITFTPNLPEFLTALLIGLSGGYIRKYFYRSSSLADELNQKRVLLEKHISEKADLEGELTQIREELNTRVINRTADLVRINEELQNEIKERKKIEMALRESESKYRHIIENAIEIIFLSDSQGRIIYVNDAAVKSSGYRFDEINTLNYFDLVHPDYRQKVKNFYFRQIISRERNAYFEFPFYSKSGDVKWWGQNSNLIYDKGFFSGFQIIARDITERKQTEEALRNSEELYRNLVENINEIYYLVDSQGKITYASQNLKLGTGYSQEEVIGKSYVRFIHRDDRLSVTEFYQKCARNGTVDTNLEFRSLRKDGSFYWAEQITRILRSADGQPVEYRNVIRDITNRKRAEEALRNSEYKYKSIFDYAPIGIFQSLLNGNIRIANLTFAKILGCDSVEEVIQLNENEIYYDKNERISLIDKFEPLGAAIGLEVRWKTKFNEPIWVQLSFHCIKNRAGQTEYFEGYITDITNKKRIDEELKKSEERYRSLFEHTSAVMLLIDPDDGSIRGANKSACDYYGYAYQDLMKMNFSLIDLYSAENLKTFTGGDITPGKDFYSSHRLSDGDIRDVEIHGGLVNINEKVTIFLIVHDITKRRTAEKQLEEYKTHLENLVEERTEKLDKVNKLLKSEIEKLKVAEENIQDQLRFRQTLIDTIPNPIFFCDTGKRYTGCNKAFEIFHGLTNEQLRGKTVFDLAPDRSLAEFHNRMDDELLKNPGEQKFETRIYNTLGKENFVMVYKATFNKSDGTVGGYVGILLDITEIKKLENEIRIALDKEKELSELKSRFISVASHEFRTPLTSILASADLLELYGRNWPESKYNEFITNIQNSVEYLNELINDVLTVSKSDSGNIKFNPAETDLLELINGILENVKMSATKSIKFEFKYKMEETIFFVDAKLITQILSNVLSNAVKYSNEGGTVNFKAEKDSKFLLFTVTDNGIGIPEEDLERLCEPFFRGQNVGSIPGTGLGLSIAKKSAEIHRGKLVVESKPNKGTKITVILEYKRRKSPAGSFHNN